MPTIIIGGDICPIESNRPHFQSGDASSLLGDLLPELSAADLVVANLECPLIESASPIQKTGPTFGEPPDCIQGIKAAGVHVLGLANNHILDHGEEGLRSTITTCRQAGIATVGAGSDLKAAGTILIREVKGIRIGIVAVADHEFSIASASTGGANPLDIIEFVQELRRNHASIDYVIVLLHGGHEFHASTPRIQRLCRFMIEMGANAVIVQHPHVLGGYEDFQHGHIVYGQGAFLMDEAIYRDLKSFHEGLLVKLCIEDNRGPKTDVRASASDGRAGREACQGEASGNPVLIAPTQSVTADSGRPPRDVSTCSNKVEDIGCPRVSSRMELIPFMQSWPPPGARKMSSEEEKELRQRLAARSKALQNRDHVEAEWARFCDERKHRYISNLLGYSRVLRKLNSNGLLTRFLYSRRAFLGIRNLVCCEAHREVLQTILENMRRRG